MSWDDYCFEDPWAYEDRYEDYHTKSYNTKRGNKMAVVQGKAYWASVQSPNTTFDPVYSIDLHVDIDTARKLKAEGLKVKKDDDGNLVVKFKRKAFKKDGSPMSKPTVVDRAKRPLTELIGNGSLVNVSYNVFDWSFGGKSGKSGGLNGVQVLDLIPYESKAADDFEVLEQEDSSFEEGSPADFDDDPFDD